MAVSWTGPHCASLFVGQCVSQIHLEGLRSPVVSYILYLQRVLGADGQDLVLEVAELAAPGAPLADPSDEAGLVGAAHRAVTAAGAQQLPLQDTQGNKCVFSERVVFLT